MFNINNATNKKPLICGLGQWVLMLFINRFPNLHKIDNLVVDCNQRTVEYLSNNSLHPVLKTSSKNARTFKISNYEFEKFNTILKNRENARDLLEEKNISNQMQDINERFDKLEHMIRQLMLQK